MGGGVAAGGGVTGSREKGAGASSSVMDSNCGVSGISRTEGGVAARITPKLGSRVMLYLLSTAWKTLNWKTYLVYPTLKLASKLILRRKIMAKLLAASVAANVGPVELSPSSVCVGDAGLGIELAL